MADEKKTKVVVVGAGPVGALAASYAAGRGHEVEVYELRGDSRDPSTVPLNFTKSINLALSERGINSMRNAGKPGSIDAVSGETIPMHGRMIHGSKGGELYEESQNYDIHGRFIRAVDRAGSNKRSSDELDNMPNVKLIFNHKSVGADYRRKKAWFEKRRDTRTDHAQNPTQEEGSSKDASEIEISFDFMIGADGAHSAVRYHSMKFSRMQYMQEYIDTSWCEFQISPSSTDDFKISPNHSHIWPGGDFMFIAIPSLDKSFTCTLFMPASHFERLDADPESIIAFFNQNFPGVADRLISASDLRKQYGENPHLPLISIKCTPYHFDSFCVILGDAAHAMVPFYGQGMNAGSEDVRVLFEFLDSHDSTPAGRAAALKEYTAQRTPDAAAINDLASRNYQEMRSDVKSPLYRLRKYVEEKMNVLFPSSGFATQYSRISFENQRYSEVEQRAQKQGQISLRGIIGLALAAVPLIGYGGWAVWRWNRASRASRGLVKGGLGFGALGERIGRIFT